MKKDIEKSKRMRVNRNGKSAVPELKTRSRSIEKAEISWGIVKITGGSHIGRIAVYDDDDDVWTDRCIVYFGEMHYVRGYHFISKRYLAEVTTGDLFERREAISRAIGFAGKNVDDTDRADLLAELLVIDNALGDRMIVARATEPKSRKRVFISHSSKDKQFARWIAVDLANAGHSAWLDEWDIRVGESIPTRVAEGIDECDALIVILTKHAVTSHWVEREWQAKYWDELKDGRVRVLPALLEECEVPTLLKTKKYADFCEAYSDGVEALLVALRS